ncbi:MAG TPA: type II toxin-antitoxin system VapC family toxin [Stellaceae bacterium]
MSLVLDASMALAWLFEDERGPAEQTILDRVRMDGAIVPSLWRLEVANVLRYAVLRQRSTEKLAAANLADLTELPIALDDETNRHAWGRTRELANEYRLSVYDATYLELALRRKLPLASRDGELNRAARRARVEVLAG